MNDEQRRDVRSTNLQHNYDNYDEISLVDIGVMFYKNRVRFFCYFVVTFLLCLIAAFFVHKNIKYNFKLLYTVPYSRSISNGSVILKPIIPKATILDDWKSQFSYVMVQWLKDNKSSFHFVQASELTNLLPTEQYNQNNIPYVEITGKVAQDYTAQDKHEFLDYIFKLQTDYYKNSLASASNYQAKQLSNLHQELINIDAQIKVCNQGQRVSDKFSCYGVNNSKLSIMNSIMQLKYTIANVNNLFASEKFFVHKPGFLNYGALLAISLFISFIFTIFALGLRSYVQSVKSAASEL